MNMLKKLANLFKTQNSNSPNFKFNGTDFMNVLKTAALVGVASAFTYFAEAFTKLDFGQLNVLIPVLVVPLLQFVQSWLADNTPKK